MLYGLRKANKTHTASALSIGQSRTGGTAGQFREEIRVSYSQEFYCQSCA